MLNINTNYAASFAANAAKQSSSGLNSAMEKLSSGSRINYAKDDAAGQAIAVRLTAEVQGVAMASRNAADAQSMIDTADGALGETHNLLLRMRELAVQSANGTLNSDDRDALDAEYQQLEAEVTRIDANTTFAGTSLFDASTKSFQVGAKSGDQVSHTFASMSATDILADIDHDADAGASTAAQAADIKTTTAAQATITMLDTAIKTVSTERGKLGAVSNRLSSTIANLDQVGVNLSASKGRIADADFAAETGNLAKNQILQQAATAMLAQANASKGSILTLIRN
jgi:flagellin